MDKKINEDLRNKLFIKYNFSPREESGIRRFVHKFLDDKNIAIMNKNLIIVEKLSELYMQIDDLKFLDKIEEIQRDILENH